MLFYTKSDVLVYVRALSDRKVGQNCTFNTVHGCRTGSAAAVSMQGTGTGVPGCPRCPSLRGTRRVLGPYSTVNLALKLRLGPYSTVNLALELR